MDSAFSPSELSRYNRHLIIPGFGIGAQQKLKAAKVLVVGAGGLGSPLLLYLAAAGIGRIGLVDDDIVSDSNLHRQVLFGTGDLGEPKVLAAKRRLQALNPWIEIETYPVRLTAANAMEIIGNYDLVADGTDNFPTRYLVNDACVLLNKPNIYASIFQFEGQVSVFNYQGPDGIPGPNFRDLYPVPPPPDAVRNCAEGGVLGVLPGIIGSLQALEVIKVITGLGEVLSGRFYIFDALSFTGQTFRVKRSSSNPLNGDHPTITELIDYETFCGTSTVKEITAAALVRMQRESEPVQVIDVREPHEYDLVNIGAERMPLADIRDYAKKIARDKVVVLHCKTGSRSIAAIRTLEQEFGFENLYSLRGGIFAYIDTVDPSLAKY